MLCPKCNFKTKVIDSRTSDTTYRRRRCKNCNYTFTTKEIECDIFYLRKIWSDIKASKGGNIDE